MKVITDVREEKIGGECEFEIDETLVHKRKYNRGRLPFNQSKQRWWLVGLREELIRFLLNMLRIGRPILLVISF